MIANLLGLWRLRRAEKARDALEIAEYHYYKWTRGWYKARPEVRHELRRIHKLWVRASKLSDQAGLEAVDYPSCLSDEEIR